MRSLPLRSMGRILRPQAFGRRALSSSVPSSRDASFVGFIGLGNMGAPMAANIAKFGHRLIIHDHDEKRAKEFSQLVHGAEYASTPREVASVARIVITMLPGAREVQKVYLDPDTGLFAEATKRSVFIDSSTVEPDLAKQLGVELTKREPGAMFVDAPVSGGVPGARDRKLTFMVGCDQATLSRVESLLKCMGQKIIACGASGSGQVAKMCNNLILGITMAGVRYQSQYKLNPGEEIRRLVCEAMSLASHLGMEAKPLTDVINVSSGRCWSTDTYHPVPGVMENVPSARDYTNGFNCDLMLKDLNISLKEAKRVKCRAPLAQLVSAMYKGMSEQGFGKKDFGSLYQHFYQQPTNDSTAEAARQAVKTVLSARKRALVQEPASLESCRETAFAKTHVQKKAVSSKLEA